MNSASTVRGTAADAASPHSPFVSSHRLGDVLRIHVIGPSVGQREAPILSEEITQAIEAAGRGLRVLLLDILDVQLMSGMGLGLCVSLSRLARDRGAKTVIHTTHELGELFRALKLERVCTIVDDEQQLQQAIAT